MNFLKWFNTWLTPEEEEQLKDPTRRVFTFGLVSAAVSLAVPLPGMSFYHQVDPYKQDSWLDGIPCHYNDGGAGTWLGLERVNYSQTIAVQLEKVRNQLPRLYARNDAFFTSIIDDKQLQPAANKGQRAKARGRA